MASNHLHYGDNLDVLREHVSDESVDLIYLDPPFNSNRSYNVLFSRDGRMDSAQMQAFDDTWHWTPETLAQYDDAINGGVPFDVADALGAFRVLLGDNDALAYLVNMAPRLVELRRVLKPTGTLYLHCDPTMSHYLKVMLDAIFGAKNYRNEIIWKRTATKGDARRKFGSVHDVLLVYGAGDAAVFNALQVEHGEEYTSRFRLDDGDGRGPYEGAPLDSPNPRPNLTYPYKGFPPPRNGWRVSLELMNELDRDNRLIFPSKPTGRIRRKNYLAELKGRPIGDVWTDIAPLNSQASERLGYPTQKPVSLIERILNSSSNPGDVVLDPFCGCGTTIEAATALDRRWIGIDVTYIAVDLIRKRLHDRYGPSAEDTYDVTGIPHDLLAAQALWEKSPFDFERWAVSLVGGTPNEKQVGDKGFDGLIRFHHSGGKGAADGKILVSVKGGRQLNPSMVQALDGALTTHRAHMGIFVSLHPVTRGMREIADRGGNYRWPANGQNFPRLQIVTIEELLKGSKPQTPPRLLPYISALRQAPVMEQTEMEIYPSSGEFVVEQPNDVLQAPNA